MMSPTACPYILARIVEKQYSATGTQYSEEHPWAIRLDAVARGGGWRYERWRRPSCRKAVASWTRRVRRRLRGWRRGPRRLPECGGNGGGARPGLSGRPSGGNWRDR